MLLNEKKILDEETLNELKEKARQIRYHILEMVKSAEVGHIGGSFSVTDILTALYFNILNVDPQNPLWGERDRLVLSKGHAATAIYSSLAERGFFPARDLLTFGKIGSKLQIHPDMRKVSGIDVSTGSLGQGLSIGIGMALAAKLDNKSYHTYVILGDGEIQEGQVWESAMFASNYNMDNITVILDYNNVQGFGQVPDIMKIEPVKEKWLSFGWKAIEIDGHNFKQIISSVNEAKAVKGFPVIIIAKTTKGKGVSFMQDTCDWHGKVPCDEEYLRAVSELRRL